MASRRILALRRASSRALLHPSIPRPTTSFLQRRWLSQEEIDDPGMNGGYINPPRQSRQFRDPYGDWWDKQERRNFGEPVHEDNDILGVFAPEEYTHFKPPMAFFLVGCAIAGVGALAGAVYLTYPDTPAAPRTFEGGLEAELGGPGAVRALKNGESWGELDKQGIPINADSETT